MPTVTSKDGTKIAFDKVGAGPVVILVNGAMVHRSSNPTMAQLAELLGEHFTVYNYDRRGRGESGDTKPFTKAREIEDIQALVEDAGGQAMIFGISSGGAVTLEATASILGITRAVVYEVPFIVDNGRQPLPDYAERSTRLVEEGKLNELVEYWVMEVVGIPAEYVAGMKQDQNMWGGMLTLAPTIPYDAAFVGEFMRGNPLPTDHWANLKVPVLVADGGASDAWMGHAADALASVLPHASRQVLKDQTHAVDPNVLAPVLIEFFKQ
jgi:pimeloyl-ACP methyl ester carboxylesterase